VRPIAKSLYPNLKGLELDSFRRQLDYLCNKYNIISTDDLIHVVKNKSSLPANPCLLTFDDGYKDHFTYVFPELQLRKVKGCFFPSAKPIIKRKVLDVNKIHFILSAQNNISILIADLKFLISKYRKEYNNNNEPLMDFNWYCKNYSFIENYDSREVIFFKRMLQYVLPLKVRKKILNVLFQRYVFNDEQVFASQLYMSIDNIKEMIANGMCFGGHGYDHEWLNKISDQTQIEEIDRSIQFLSKMGISTKDWIMSYPYGGYNKKTLEILRSRNCFFGFTIESKPAVIQAGSLLELGRFDTNVFTK
jgi:hypothetical protein